MSESAQPDKSEQLIAEDILRAIYGDDFKGCTVRLDDIAALISAGRRKRQVQAEELLDLYEKLIEALDLLSTPPDIKKVTDPNELRTLLSERLDAIHTLTARTMETTALAKKQRDGIEPG
jgi:hypothetical protein